MSLFDGLRNIQRPDVRMNEGPLPTSGPPYFPSAKINYASDLLGDHIQAYSYGQADHVSDQTSYLAVAHRIQKIIPQISLPNASSEGSFSLSHGVDVGDIAFVLRTNRRGSVIPSVRSLDRIQMSRKVDPMVNLATVNYILAGIQRHWQNKDARNWQQLIVDLCFEDDPYKERSAFSVGDAIRFVSNVGSARPFGVPHTSELQGGQHEGGNGAVQYPVSFVSTFFVSGLARNICNIWRQHNISAGDDLIFHLEKLPISTRDGSLKYRLNHWKKATVSQQFRYEEGGVNEAWQLVPGVLSTYTPDKIVENYDYRENGYWHICRSQVMLRSNDTISECPSASAYYDDQASMQGALIQATFEPVWVEYIPWAPPRGVKRPPVSTAQVPRFGWSKVSSERFGWSEEGLPEQRGRRVAHDGVVHEDGVVPEGGGVQLGDGGQRSDVAEPPSGGPEVVASSLSSKMPPKKPRRTLGLAVGLAKAGPPVSVQSISE